MRERLWETSDRALGGSSTEDRVVGELVARLALEETVRAPDGGLKRLGRIRGRSVDLQGDGWVRSNVALGLFVEAEHRRPRGRINIQANAEGLRSVPRGQGALHALDLDVDR